MLHVMTLLEFAVLLVFLPALVPFDADTVMEAVLKTLALVFLISLPVFSQLDARSRFQSYKRVKDNLSTHGFDPRIIRPFIRSQCQRDAVLAAADELGYDGLCRNYFRFRGYRWYHILPDFVFTDPACLLTGRFWKTTFFAKTYHSKTGL